MTRRFSRVNIYKHKLPTFPLLGSLLKLGGQYLGVVLRTQKGKSRLEPSPGVLKETEGLFATCIVDRFMARTWPGTCLCKGKGLVYIVSLNDHTVDLVAEKGPRLDNWVETNGLPEDLFVCSGGPPLFFSIIHEFEAYVRTDLELPSVSGRLEKPVVDCRFGERFCCSE